MEVDKLRKLAEWYGAEFRLYNKDNAGGGKEHYGWIINGVYKGEFKPYKNSNQLDMLEDKMWQGLDSTYIKISYGSMYLVSYIKVKRWGGEEFEEQISYGYGKTKNEARLNAILNYIRRLKK